MGQAMRRRIIDIIPNDIKKVFEEADIPKIFDLLETYFHTSKGWRNEYTEKLKMASREQDEREVFALFLKENIDPSLKHLLKRDDSVIFSLMRYVLRDRILEYKSKEERMRNYYKKDR